MTSIWRSSVAALNCSTGLLVAPTPLTAADPATQIRFENSRIAEVFRFASDHSPSFRNLIATLELLDRVVYVEEGRCRHRELRASLKTVGHSSTKVASLEETRVDEHYAMVRAQFV